jgi:hypothetical protein
MNSLRKWTEDEDELLLAMKAEGKHVSVIARTLRRTEVAVRLRMDHLKKRDSRQELRELQ